MNYSTKVFTCKWRHPVKNEPVWWCWWGAEQLTEMRKINIHALGEISALDFGFLWA